jgi:hypothetical protein
MQKIIRQTIAGKWGVVKGKMLSALIILFFGKMDLFDLYLDSSLI